MRAVVQRVTEASVSVEGEVVGAIGAGFVVLLGVRADDGSDDVDYIADKVANLRVFGDDEGRMNRSLLETGGDALMVSQFTLYGDARRGRRPSFIAAAGGQTARDLYVAVCDAVRLRGVRVERGSFGAMMKVSLVNDGPVTVLLDSRRQF